MCWDQFQSGTVVGSLIVLGLTVQSKAATINTGIYLAFMIIMLFGAVISWAVLPAHKVVRHDGTIGELSASQEIS